MFLPQNRQKLQGLIGQQPKLDNLREHTEQPLTWQNRSP